METEQRFTNEILDQRNGQSGRCRVVLKLEGDAWKGTGRKTWYAVLRFVGDSSIPDSRQVFYNEKKAREYYEAL